MRKTLFAALLLPALTGCGSTGSFATGVGTEAELRARHGAPGMIWNEPDGSRLLEYSGQPNGTFAHMVLVAADGRVREIRQAFTEANFRRLVPGLTQDEVRRLLGRPEERLRFHLKPDEEVWTWRIADTTEKTEYLNAYFGPDGRLLRSDRTIHYKASGPSFTQGEIDRHSRRG